MPARNQIENIIHDGARRANIPTSELQAIVPDTQKAPVKVAYEKGRAGRQKWP